MATSSRGEKWDLRDRMYVLLAVVLLIAMVVLGCMKISSCREKGRLYTATSNEREALAHIDDTDPASLTPHQGFPYVIADDDLCRIVITDEVYMIDEKDYHGYGQTLSKNGYEFELTIENKSEYLTIGAGIAEEPWTATGDYSMADGDHHEEDMSVSYNGFLNKIGPGESDDGTFALFNRNHGNLVAVDSVYGVFEICDEKNQTIATYPFSYVKE